MTIGCIIQARLGSTRLPKKIIQLLDKKFTVLDYVINQTINSKLLEKIIIATTNLEEDKIISETISQKNINYFYGDSSDVLDRYYQCAKKFSLSTIVRITSDCPLVDPNIIDNIIEIFKNNSFDYVSNVHPSTFPIGIAVEVFSFESLEKAWKNAKLPSEREHVTPYLYNHNEKFNIFNLEYTTNLTSIRITIDRKNDLKVVRNVVSKIKNRPILLSDIIKLYNEDPKMFELNQDYNNNEGYLKSLEIDKQFSNS
jgi:spore coat polysaccharide biosynthesis protein SpsF|tara:strand:- start:638 stop:1402 length:765 start_codon:yes stop_codon:yes gene_type:complete